MNDRVAWRPCDAPEPPAASYARQRVELAGHHLIQNPVQT